MSYWSFGKKFLYCMLLVSTLFFLFISIHFEIPVGEKKMIIDLLIHYKTKLSPTLRQR